MCTKDEYTKMEGIYYGSKENMEWNFKNSAPYLCLREFLCLHGKS